MLTPHSRYTEISISSLKFNPKSQEIIKRKQDILQAVAKQYTVVPTSILFVGFSTMILNSSCSDIYVTAVTEETRDFLELNSVKYTYIKVEDLQQYNKHFDWVVAIDEYFTFATTEQEQAAAIVELTNLAKQLIVTTLKDYKNQEFRDRDFSQPQAVYNRTANKIFLEHHLYNFAEKESWSTTVYELINNTVISHGLFPRRALFFKQLAKFSFDAGAKEFHVHKNLMYKSLIKRNYEHVITIRLP